MLVGAVLSTCYDFCDMGLLADCGRPVLGALKKLIMLLSAMTLLGRSATALGRPMLRYALLVPCALPKHVRGLRCMNLQLLDISDGRVRLDLRMGWM